MVDTLREAQVTVSKRAIKYGSPVVNFERISQAWSLYLGRPISYDDFVNLMILLKVMRDAENHNPDNHLDIAGYICALDSTRESTYNPYSEDEVRELMKESYL